MLFTELPFMERFAAASRAGFEAVEVQYPYEWNQVTLKRELEKNKQQLVLFNLPAGNFAAGDRGIAADPLRQAEFRAGVQLAVAWAKELEVLQLNCPVGKQVNHCSWSDQRQMLLDNITYAAEVLEHSGIRLLIEPLNHLDVPGFLLNTTAQVLDLINQIDHSNIYLQYDMYHAYTEQENLISVLQQNLDKIGHIQIADSPGRHQPGTGTINYQYLLTEIQRLDYRGYVSLEYLPYPDTVSSFVWLEKFSLVK
jgi:hydroxypyruvate isomerase